jgi:hypothetical protein
VQCGPRCRRDIAGEEALTPRAGGVEAIDAAKVFGPVDQRAERRERVVG